MQPEGYNVSAVEAWVVDNVPALTPPFKWTRLEGGHSNLTYQIEDQKGPVSYTHLTLPTILRV